MLKIGFSACFLHKDPTRRIFKGKTLIYMEESLVHWLKEEGVLVVLVPTLGQQDRVALPDLVSDLDGLLLQGGDDVSPAQYGEIPLRPEWKGDAIRDQYEINLINEFLKQRKPIFGLCRGIQILNVCLGGSLYQDIATQRPDAVPHRNWDLYENLFHEIEWESGSLLSSLFPGKNRARVNSIHHQAIKDLGKHVKVEARSAGDGIVEAIRMEGDSFAYACQWHPEFQDPADKSLLDGKPILRRFLSEAQARRG